MVWHPILLMLEEQPVSICQYGNGAIKAVVTKALCFIAIDAIASEEYRKRPANLAEGLGGIICLVRAALFFGVSRLFHIRPSHPAARLPTHELPRYPNQQLARQFFGLWESGPSSLDRRYELGHIRICVLLQGDALRVWGSGQP